jgi:hypothetical protein
MHDSSFNARDIAAAARVAAADRIRDIEADKEESGIGRSAR